MEKLLDLVLGIEKILNDEDFNKNNFLKFTRIIGNVDNMKHLQTFFIEINKIFTNLENENSIEKQKDENYTNEQTELNELDEKSIEIKDEYKFGWSSYSEITNGRFAMIGFLAIILIELFSKQSFLKWAGIL